MNTTSLPRYFASSGEATIEADRITDHWEVIKVSGTFMIDWVVRVAYTRVIRR
jgi:hypothetical protein